MELQALLFDVDGTLADTERDGHRMAFNAAFREYGLDWDWDVALYGKLLAVTGGKERMKYYVAHFRTDYAPAADFADLVAELHRAKTRHYTELLSHGEIPMRPGVKRLLQRGALGWAAARHRHHHHSGKRHGSVAPQPGRRCQRLV